MESISQRWYGICALRSMESAIGGMASAIWAAYPRGTAVYIIKAKALYIISRRLHLSLSVRDPTAGGRPSGFGFGLRPPLKMTADRSHLAG